MIEDSEVRSLFKEECEEKLHAIEENLQKIEADPDNPEIWNALLRDVHTLKGSARMLKLDSIEILSHRLEDALGMVRKKTLILDANLSSLFFEIVDAIHAFASEATEGTVANINIKQLLSEIPTDGTKPAVTLDEKPVKESAKVEPVIIEKAEPSKQESPPPKVEAKLSSADTGIKISTIRVQIDQVNDMLAKIVELVVVKTQIEHLLTQINDSNAILEEKRFYKEQFGKLENQEEKTKELDAKLEQTLFDLRNQASDPVYKLHALVSGLANDMRNLGLIPISKLFDPFPRMMRELAHNLGKKINFVIDSEPIGFERKIIEGLKDPLMHLLTNALSHGIEPPQIRTQFGKDPIGKILLRARKTGFTIVIEITDDGMGVNIENIKSKAIEKGLFSEEQISHMTEEQIMDLIFLPGFSTATTITETFGRGVGLDVVRNAVKLMRGKVQLISNPGRGSTFRIELPVAYLTTHVMLIKQSDRLFAIPAQIIESCRIFTKDQISTIENHKIVQFNDEAYPLFWLANLLGLNKLEKLEDREDFTCLLLNEKEQRIALIVDVILEEQEIMIESSWQTFLELKGIVGTSILKNGEVALVLNPFGLIEIK